MSVYGRSKIYIDKGKANYVGFINFNDGTNYIMGAGGSALTGLWSLMGAVGKTSSLGSTTDTLSGRGFLGPILPCGSHGNIIFTLIPSTPVNIDSRN